MKFDLKTAIQNPHLVQDQNGRGITSISIIEGSMDPNTRVIVTFHDGRVQLFSELGVSEYSILRLIKDYTEHQANLKIIDWRLFSKDTLIKLPGNKLVRFHNTNDHFVSYYRDGADRLTSSNSVMRTKDARLVMDNTIRFWDMEHSPMPEGVSLKVFYSDGKTIRNKVGDASTFQWNSGQIDGYAIIGYSVNGASPGWSPFFMSVMERANNDSYSSNTDGDIQPTVTVDDIIANTKRNNEQRERREQQAKVEVLPSPTFIDEQGQTVMQTVLVTRERK